MTGAGTSCEHFLRAHLALPLFTLLSHHKHLTKKSTTHNTPNPITPASTRHQNRFCVGSIMAERMSRGGAKVKSTGTFEIFLQYFRQRFPFCVVDQKSRLHKILGVQEYGLDRSKISSFTRV